MIVPDPSLNSPDSLGIKKMMDELYTASISQWQSYWTQANIDQRFAVGDQRFLAGIDGEFYQNQKFVFNIIHQYRQAILGHQRRNRRSSVVVPVEGRDQQLADDYSGALIWTMQTDSMLHKISDAFDVALVQGMCLMHRWIDKRDDPVDGVIRLKTYAPTTFICDPYWRERDLSDCRFIWTRDFVSGKQLTSLLPWLDGDLSAVPKTYNSSIRFNFMPESYQITRRQKDNYAYDQFYYASERKAHLVHSYKRSETYEFQGDEDSRRMWVEMEFDDDERADLEELAVTKPCVRLAVAVNDRVLYDEHFADQYPYTPMIAYFEPNSVNYNYRFYGVPRIIRDIQYLFNRRMQIQLDILESLPSSGINVVEDALVDKMDAFKQGPGQVRVIRKGYLPDQGISQINPPQVDASALKMTDDLNGLSRQLVGINEELLGMADDSKAGITEMLRQGASLTILQTLFDNLDLSQKMLSKALLADIQSNYSPSKVERILGRPATNAFWNTNIKKFDVEIEDGLNTSTQKQQQFAQLLNLRKEGVPISPQMLLKSSTLQNKQDLIDDVEQQMQQQMQQAQAEAQAQQAVAQAQAELYSTQAEAQKSYAIEKLSRVAENQQMAIERAAKADLDQDEAVLKQVETIKKLQEIDLSNLEKFVRLVESLKAGQQSASVQGHQNMQTQEIGNGLYRP